LPLQLLVANSGSAEAYANDLAQQIVQLVQHDHTIIGVMGWPFSTQQTMTALATLGQAHIPSVSPSLSSNDFTDISDYFVRVAPPDLQQSTYGADFAKTHLQSKNAAVFLDYSNLYSRSLALSFAASFEDSTHKVSFVRYTRNEDVDKALAFADKALAYHPDLIYFAGYASDFDPLRGYLMSVQPQMHVMGGDGLYELGGYTHGNANFRNIYFTTFAGTYQKNGMREPRPFADTYSSIFNPLKIFPNAIDAGIAEGDAIMAYDATNLLLTAYQRLQQAQPSLMDIQHSLLAINTNREGAVQGASGRISIGADHNPEDKSILVEYAQYNGDVCIAAVYGKFLADQQSASAPSPDCPANI
jgi:ABC-type branched-subunit amino acid transport system substrate-binding protein